MREITDRYATVSAGFITRVDGCASDRWSSPSPCANWTARDVVTDVVGGHRRAIAGLDGGKAAPLGSDEDVVAAWRPATSAGTAALADATRAERVITTPFGEQSFAALVGSALCADTLVHTWDLARATGQDERLDPATVAAASAWVTPLDALMRRPGVFGPKVPPPPDADAQTVFLCPRATRLMLGATRSRRPPVAA